MQPIEHRVPLVHLRKAIARLAEALVQARQDGYRVGVLDTLERCQRLWERLHPEPDDDSC